MKVHLVDGTYELFRAYYGVPPAHDAAGRPVGALRGILATLIALLRETEVTHVACAFDHVIESFRNELFPGYKTGDGVDPDLLAQFQPAEEAVQALGVVVWPMVEFEADDALATAAARFRADPAVEQVVICSPDKDFSQCVTGSRVVCRDRRRRDRPRRGRGGRAVRRAARFDPRLARSRRRHGGRHPGRPGLGREVGGRGARLLSPPRVDSRRGGALEGRRARARSPRRRARREPEGRLPLPRPRHAADGRAARGDARGPRVAGRAARPAGGALRFHRRPRANVERVPRWREG